MDIISHLIRRFNYELFASLKPKSVTKHLKVITRCSLVQLATDCYFKINFEREIKNGVQITQVCLREYGSFGQRNVKE